MATSEAQKRAAIKYMKEKTKAYTMRFYPTDADLLAWFESQPNKQGYIKRLIRDDMENAADKR